jgi:hypothetical protein
MRFRATMIALAVGGIAAGRQRRQPGFARCHHGDPTTTTMTSPGQARVANKFAAPFTTMAGSTENAVALATALRTGTPVTLTYTTDRGRRDDHHDDHVHAANEADGLGQCLAFAGARAVLAQSAGHHQPDRRAAATALTAATSRPPTVRRSLAGVLQQRADGMGWGKIAQSYGTTMGAVNRGIKAPAVATTTTTTTTAKSTTATPKPVVTKTASPVTAAGTTSASSGPATRGLTTAGGTAAGTGPAAKGLTTASGATTSGSSSGIVTADGGSHGNGNAYGRGVVTASGNAAGVSAAGGKSSASSGIVTGAGATGSGMATANPGQGGGAGNANGKGKSGG